MTSPTTIESEPHHLEGRSVRDVVETDPAAVDEVWCRRIFRQILQSLELQYAMHLPRRWITPDTIVFHQNGEPLLLADDLGPPGADEAEDLSALARVIHFAITQELAPSGPLHGRAAGYSDSLVAAVDACMDPDPARRPHSIAALRELLGIVTLGPLPEAPLDLPDGSDADATVIVAGPAPAGTPAPAAAPLDASGVAPAPTAAPTPVPTSTRPAASIPAADAAPASAQAASSAHTASSEPASATVPAAAPAPSAAPVSASVAASAAAPAARSASFPGSAPVPKSPSVQAPESAPRPVPAPLSSSTAGVTVPPQVPRMPSANGTADAAAAASAHDLPRQRAGLSRWQRWAIAAGGVAALVAIALALFAELRDSGAYDHIVLTLPQTGDGTQATQAPQNGASAAAAATTAGAPAAAPAPAGGTPAPDGSTPASTPATATRLPDIDLSAPAAGAAASPSAAAGAGADSGAGPSAGASAGTSASAAGTAAQAGSAYKVQIAPWGVVYVDGVDRGVSPPVKRLVLAPGRHTVRVTNPNFQDRVFDVDSTAGDSRIAVDFGDAGR